MPKPLGSKSNTFWINDIALTIPPTDIQVQKEDLTYSWRTLRTSTSTKIASGHGQVAISLTIPFTEALLLEMHRLIVEFKHSPFCYIDNRYLRETLVPEWPLEQNMAFTMTSLVVSPMQGSSDSWIMQLDLTWFNYFSYVPNYLFRDDWVTRWIDTPDGAIRNSIGWVLDSNGSRRSIPSLVETNSDTNIQGVPRWDLEIDGIASKGNRTIFDMEQAHDGQVFDLLPLPGNMEPSRFVYRPSESKIYTRYINLLQRDALKLNFDIDVEQDLIGRKSTIDSSVDLVQLCFAAGKRGSEYLTVSLISDEIPSDIQSKWRSKMTSFNDEITFIYDVYKDIRFPEQWTKSIDGIQPSFIERISSVTNSGAPGSVIEIPFYLSGERTKIRNGYTFPNGKHVPVRASITELNHNLTSRIGNRARDGKPDFHNGIDYGVRVKGVHQNLDVYAVEDGVVEDIRTYSSFEGGLDDWRVIDDIDNQNINSVTKRFRDMSSQQKADLNQAIAGMFPGTQSTSDAFALMKAKNLIQFGSGTVIRSQTKLNRIFYKDFNAGGQQIRIAHRIKRADGSSPVELSQDGLNSSYSYYLHLSEILVQKGETVRAGKVIGRTGGTGPLDPAWIAWAWRKQGVLIPISSLASRLDPQDLQRNVYRDNTGSNGEVGPIPDDAYNQWIRDAHLHFEYWEPLFIAGVESTGLTPEPTKQDEGKRTSKTHILVAAYTSYEAAKDQNLSIITGLDTAPVEPTQEDLTTALDASVKDGLISDSERQAFQALLLQLAAEGWQHYEDTTNITNVWKKTLRHRIASVDSSKGIHATLETIRKGKSLGEQSAVQDNVVLTNVMGGLKHIVANLPILSQEYPTQQHLGSIEPQYTLEFAVIDDANDLEGIPKSAQLLTTMCSKLQTAARDFRGVKDGWCCITDTFITRLFGSFKQTDYHPRTFRDFTPEFRKRISVSRSNIVTMSGNPGLSTLVLSLEETNPYETERIISTSIGFEAKEASRKAVLQALYRFDLSGKVDKSFLPLLLMQLSGSSKSPNGHFGLARYGSGLLESLGAQYGNAFISTNAAGEQVFLIRSSTETREILDLIKSSDGSFQYQVSNIDQGFYEINAADYDQLKFDNSTSDNTIFKDLLGGSLPLPIPTINNAVVGAQRDLYFTTIDASYYVQQDQGLVDLDFNKLLELKKLLGSTMLTGELILSENIPELNETSLGPIGLDIGFIRSELYDLPFRASQWSAFQYYLELFINRVAATSVSWVSPDPDILKSNPTYIKDWDSRLSLEGHDFIRAIYDYWFSGLFGPWIQRTEEVAQTLIESIVPGGRIIENLPELLSIALTDTRLTSRLRAADNEARVEFIKPYLQHLPLAIYVSQLVGGELKNSIEGIIGDWTPGVGFGKQLLLEDQYLLYLNSNALITPSGLTGIGVNESGAAPELENGLTALRGLTASPRLVDPVFAPLESGALSLLINPVLGGTPTPTSKQTSNDLNFRKANSPSLYDVNTTEEKAKVQYLKGDLVGIADVILGDIELLTLLGLEKLVDIDSLQNLAGSECYPDLILPGHPYYQDSIDTAPDFYMWNVYEDGGLLSRDIKDEVAGAVNQVIQNSYNSLKKFEFGQDWKPENNPIIEEKNIDVFQSKKVTYSAEATDGTKDSSGPMATPFAPSEKSTKAEETFYKSFNKNWGTGISATPSVVQNLKSISVNGKSNTEPAWILDAQGNKTYAVTLSNTDGSVLYGNRVSPETYKELQTKIQQIYSQSSTDTKRIESMFGSSSGHRGNLLVRPSFNGDIQEKDANFAVTSSLTGTEVDPLDEYTHAFDPASMQKLAIESSVDVVSQRMTLRRAYPTFKLFFVEEDEAEDRFLNFDDFYSYNAVKEFSVVMNRNMSAETATIVLQNVSGTLDGSARNVVTDLDYFEQRGTPGDPSRTDKIQIANPTASVAAEDLVTKDTSADQPFGAVVLRPGLNVQLRAGFSNDPNALEVLISGRIVDVTWNQGGDLVEVVVQSFGTELEQILKGTNNDDTTGITYYTTHQLLGSLMLSPELVHFGRWEFGPRFQIGEGQDSRLDFVDYTREGILGQLKTTSFVASSIASHSLLSTLLKPDVALTSLGVAVSIDVIRNRVLDPLYDATIGKIQRAFTRAQVSLTLSPADDNLYPPSPKDYMLVGPTSFLAEAAGFIAGKASAWLPLGEGFAPYAESLARGDRSFGKKVSPQQCQYQIISQTIWDTFYEMTLRHPGWVYGPRPYGREFRYTMFFGVPSQRYWSRPAPNNFINRMNTLKRSLSGGDLTEQQYKSLYGDDVSGLTIQQYKDLIAEARSADGSNPTQQAMPGGVFGGALATATANSSTGLERILSQTYTARALSEYAHGLELRFVPYRRYHILSSERDIVWNGIISSESGVANAVDVSWYPVDATNDVNTWMLSPSGTVVIKASTSIPPELLRISPIQYSQCKGYTMAMRYGMGELIHRMSEMYRGEIVITGNARIRPNDIGILVDTYNDMVGPIVVDQVVHTFSHETGFITEIKPAALIIGNEISSWPIFEAMKMFSLAVDDAEQNFKGAGTLGDKGLLNLLTSTGSFFRSKSTEPALLEKYKSDNFFDQNSNILEEIFKDRPAPQGGVLSGVSDVSDLSFDFLQNLLIGGASTATVSATAFSGGVSPFLASLIPLIGESVLFAEAKNTLKPPSLAWLIAGTVILAKCLREDAVMVVPLMKNGTPIVSGISDSDPSTLWSHVAGNIENWVDDAVNGTRDGIRLYQRYGSAIWKEISKPGFGRVANLTGE